LLTNPIPALTLKERNAFVGLLLILLTGLCLPFIPQSEQYHHFADQRTWLGIPHAADVLTNLIFTVTGLLGLWTLRPTSLQTTAWSSASWPLWVFFLGLTLTGPGSSWYHWAPTSASLVWDRLPMVIAFAGIVGTFLAQRVSARMGLFSLAITLVTGGFGLWQSVSPGNLAWYVTVQFGGLLGILVGLGFTAKDKDPLPWWTLLGWYALAKVLEAGDGVVWAASGHLFAGHALKHLAAGMAGVVMLRAIRPKN